jgi:hypothetical protein
LFKDFWPKSYKNVESLSVLNSLFLPEIKAFMSITHFKNVWPLFGHFYNNLPKFRPQIVLAAKIFMGPLLCFAAEISASWQHCIQFGAGAIDAGVGAASYCSSSSTKMMRFLAASALQHCSTLTLT